jgi:hypothetical protein
VPPPYPPCWPPSSIEIRKLVRKGGEAAILPALVVVDDPTLGQRRGRGRGRGRGGAIFVAAAADLMAEEEEEGCGDEGGENAGKGDEGVVGGGHLAGQFGGDEVLRCC